MTIQTKNRSTAEILDLMPDAAQRERSQSGSGRGLANVQGARSLVISALKGRSRVLRGLAFAAATAGTSTAALYRVKHAAGAVLVDGKAIIEAAADPLILIGAGKNIDAAIDLDGGDAEVLAAAGKACWCVLLSLFVDGVGKMVAVFGDAADNGDEAAPSYAQIRAALAEKYGDDWDGVAGVVIGRVKFQRQKVITYTAAGTIAENDELTITINGTDYTVTADGDDVAADIGGKLRAAIDTNEAGVTCSGTGADVILTADTGETFTSSSSADNDATLEGVQADTITETITDPDANAALLAERSAGALWEDAE